MNIAVQTNRKPIHVIVLINLMPCCEMFPGIFEGSG